jgi:pterin-4a-carbinolamine dehydratase
MAEISIFISYRRDDDAARADDWVRQEIEFARDRTVIPITCGGASVPPAHALPDSISYLASRQGASVRDEFADTDLLLHDWEVIETPLPENPDQRRIELHRTFVFRSFRDVLVFMAEAGEFADDANHHPRWENIFKTLRIYLTTWDIGHRISHSDLQLARYFDRAYQRYRES